MSICGAASRQTSLLGEAVTYFQLSNLVESEGSINLKKNGVLAGTYRPNFSKTQLNDALIESYADSRFGQF